MQYKFCPECGSKLTGKKADDEGKVPFCESCDRYWFDTFGSCSIVLLANEFNEIALLSQKYLSDKYKTFVSGYIAPGESAEETALREVKEELGITPDRLEYAGTYWFGAKELLMHGFIGYVSKCDFVLSEEVDAAQWVPAADAGSQIFPDAPGNAAYAMYKMYLSRYN